MIRHLTLAAMATAWLALAGGCMSPKGDTEADQRAAALKMRDEALDHLYLDYPYLKKALPAAPGYAVFRNFGMKILLAGGGSGYGVLHDNQTGKDVYMRMAEVNVGLGVAARETQTVFLFNKPDVMHTFATSGWDFSGDAEAAAALNHDGAQAGASESVHDMEVYQMTKNGVALAASVGGTKYWKDDKLND